MQLQHATELELYLYAACIRAERELPASNIATAVVKGMSDAANELQRLRAENERLQSESAAFEKLASDYQDVIARLDGELDRLRERCEAAEKLVASAPEFTIWPVWIRHRLMNQRLHWEAYNWITGQTLMKDKMPVQFESPQHAASGAIAAGWLPDSKNKGGE